MATSLPPAVRSLGVVLAAATLLLGSATTVLAARAASRATDRYLADGMDRRAESVRLAVTAETQRYADVLSGLAGATAAAADLTAADFSSITAHVGRRGLPGLTGVSYVTPVATADVPGRQAYWRAHGSPGLTLRPAAGPDDHRFTIFNVVFDGGPTATGVDLARSAEAVDAMNAARGSGVVVASHSYVLLKDRGLPRSEQQLSVVLAAPVLSRPDSADAGRVQGWLLMGLRGQSFLTGTLDQLQQNSVNVTLDDVSDRGAEVAVATLATGPRLAGGVERRLTIPIGGRDWRMTVEPTADLLPAGQRHRAAVVGVTGLVLTALLAGLLWVLATSRSRAVALVREATGALRDAVREQERLASTDALTGLYNRRYFQTVLAAEVERAAADRRPVALLILDLDHFKEVNDRYGHPGGDAVLVEVARRIGSAVRDGDLVARYGGEEFVLLSVGLTAPAALARGEQIRQLLRAVPVPVGDAEVRVTASVGVAACSGDTGTGLERLLADADRALYAAKAGGRDRSVLADPAGSRPRVTAGR